ncbi:MAG: metal-sensing transcriptional repressor [Patescibacteria group bacterium]
MKTTEQRINNIIGQLEGVKKSLSQKNKDCFKLIIQLKAIKSAASALIDKVIQDEFVACWPQSQAKKDKIQKIFTEIIKK